MTNTNLIANLPQTLTREAALMAMTDEAIWAARCFMRNEGFVDVSPHMPLIVGVSGACENVDTLYKVLPSPSQSYLAQSCQLYLEVHTNSLPSKKVYCVVPSSRAELEVDNRHLNQFPLWELELNGDLDTLLDYIEKTVKLMVRSGVASVPAGSLISPWQAQYLFEHTEKPWVRMTYSDAVQRLQEMNIEIQFGDDLRSKHELALAELFGPMFITHFPLPIKFFNMRQNEQDPRLVNSADLILPRVGESAGAAEREHEYDRIVTRLKSSIMYQRLIELGGTDADFEWYLSAHRDKQIPLHSGCGIGVSRVLQWILGSPDIHDSMVYPTDFQTVY